MIRLPVHFHTLRGLGHVGRCGAIERLASERFERAEAGFRLAGIEQTALGRAVEVRDGAGMRRDQGGRIHVRQERVKLVHVPVGIDDGLAYRRQTRADRLRNVGAGVRHAQQQLGTTLS